MSKVILSLLLILGASMAEAGTCSGRYINPVTDVCWTCLLPMTIGQTPVAPGTLPDTTNPSSPIGWCGSPIPRVGLNIGYWEPFAVTDVTPTPYCMVNLGGIIMDLGVGVGEGGREMSEQNGAFYHAHWYKYPLISWLNLITSSGCMEGGDLDIAYFSELDVTWNDDELAAIYSPEDMLFSNPASQAACSADSIGVSTLHLLPSDLLYWCAGSQGSMFPLSGHVGEVSSPMQAAVLLSERLDFKMHRLFLVKDTSSTSLCNEYSPITLPKSRYRYQLTNTIADASHCYPFGYTTLFWEAGNLNPADASHFGFLMWRKRNCTYL